MCHVCETRNLCKRIAKQIKNIDDGGSVSLDAIREIMSAALIDLSRYGTAATASAAIMQGALAIEISLADVHKDETPETCGAVH